MSAHLSVSVQRAFVLFMCITDSQVVVVRHRTVERIPELEQV